MTDGRGAQKPSAIRHHDTKQGVAGSQPPRTEYEPPSGGVAPTAAFQAVTSEPAGASPDTAAERDEMRRLLSSGTVIPDTAAERDEMRRLLSSGTVIPDTNVCIDYLHYAAERALTNTQETLDYIGRQRENRADDIAHECLGEAMRQKRVEFPHVISSTELDRRLERMRDEALGSGDVDRNTIDIAAMIDGMRESSLFHYSKDPEHVRKKCSEATAEKVRLMYEGFRDREETKKIIASIIERGKEYPPKGADIYILGFGGRACRGGRRRPPAHAGQPLYRVCLLDQGAPRQGGRRKPVHKEGKGSL